MAALIPFDNFNDYRTTALKRVEGKDLKNKTIIITGASGALGKEMTLALSSAGATVIAAGRSLSKLEATKEDIMKKQKLSKSDENKEKEGGGSIVCMALDLMDYNSVKEFVSNVRSQHSKVDVLVNNAGMVPPPAYKESKNGLECTFQANFVSTVVLTEMMLPLLQKAENGRVVHLSSLSHADAPKPINWDVIPSTADTFGGYDKDYAESKWLLTAYSASLNYRFTKQKDDKSESKTIVSVCADPGVSPDSAMWDHQTFLIRFLARYVFKFLTKTSAQAAACATQVAIADDIEGGGLYQSGVLVPPLRNDTKDLNEWKKMVAVLEKSLPDDLKVYAVSVPE